MQRKTFFLFLIYIFTLTGCTPTTQSDESTFIPSDFTPKVSVTGTLLPEKRTQVYSLTSGLVNEILVKEGDSVFVGELLAVVDDKDAMIAVNQAEAALAVAKAELDQMKAGTIPEEIAVAEAQYMAANATISQTVAQRNVLDAGGYATQLETIKAQVAAAFAERYIANQKHEDAMKCYDVQKPDGTTDSICPTLGTIEEQTRMLLLAADAALEAVETQEKYLYPQHRAQIQVADSAIAVSEAQAAVALAQLDMVKTQPLPEAIRVTEAMVNQAEMTVNSARVVLERTRVLAQIPGIVGYSYIRVGDYISPGMPLFNIGDPTSYHVETTDLDEIDVMQISLGQQAVVTFEALPNEIFDGTVAYIAPMATPGGGGVNYTVHITINDIHPQLRWGMTAFVDISAVE